jgi:hypothetical protein
MTTLIVGDPDLVRGELPGLNLGEAVILPAEAF